MMRVKVSHKKSLVFLWFIWIISSLKVDFNIRFSVLSFTPVIGQRDLLTKFIPLFQLGIIISVINQ